MYQVNLPNYFDTDKISDVLREVRTNYLGDTTIDEYRLMGDDSLTQHELKQLDIHGKIVDPLTVLHCDLNY